MFLPAVKITGASTLGSDGSYGVEAAGKFVTGHNNSVDCETKCSNGCGVGVVGSNDANDEEVDAEFDVQSALESDEEVLDFLAEALDAEGLDAGVAA
jgi:hypothetical protein